MKKLKQRQTPRKHTSHKVLDQSRTKALLLTMTNSRIRRSFRTGLSFLKTSEEDRQMVQRVRSRSSR